MHLQGNDARPREKMKQLKKKIMQTVVAIKRPKETKERQLYIHYQVCTRQCPRPPGFSTCAQQCARASSGILQVWLRTLLGLDFPPPHCSKLGTICRIRGHSLPLPSQGRVRLLYIHTITCGPWGHPWIRPWHKGDKFLLVHFKRLAPPLTSLGINQNKCKMRAGRIRPTIDCEGGVSTMRSGLGRD